MKNEFFNVFDIEEDITYLNTAFMSPLMKSVEEIGVKAVQQKSRPYQITGNDFFEPQAKLRQTFAELIDCEDADRIAIIPSVSYGMAIVAKNLDLSNGNEIVVVGDQFPSNVYPWRELEKTGKAKVITARAPKLTNKRGKIWNETILNCITENTAMVAVPHIHWADGTLFDLVEIRKKTKAVGALLVIDNTQSLGVLPFSINEIQPDAVICAGYKWLFGPYSICCAFFGAYFDAGKPVEESWYNRLNSDDFGGLVNYQDNYRSKALKYSVGESSNFILGPMLTASIRQIIEWTPVAIEKHCDLISQKAIVELRSLGLFVEEDSFRSKHLFGIGINDSFDMSELKAEFSAKKIHVSYRGDFIRVASYLFNDESDFEKLVEVFRKCKS